MTEPGSMEPFETRFADRVRAYTDVATARRIDALGVARTARSSERTRGWSEGRLGAELLDRRLADGRWAAAFVVVVLIGVVAISLLDRPPDSGVGPQPAPAISSTPSPATSAGGPIPDVLRHSWERPYAVTPDLDQWPSGFLSLLASGLMDFGPAAGTEASRSSATAAGLDTLVVTATDETKGCAIGDIGAYRWSVEGKGTVMTLTAISADACVAREEALAGQWVRSDLPLPGDGEATLPPGTYLTSAFDPFDKPGMSGQLSYTVPSGWVTFEDEPAVSFTLEHRSNASASQPSTHLVIVLIAQPRMAADTNGTPCGSFGDAPGVGLRVDEIVAAIQARAGVVSKAPAAVTIGGYEGQMLDLHLAPSWTGGCLAPEGAVVGVPILHGDGPGTGPLVGIGPDHPLRLILLDLAGGRTMGVAIFNIEPSQASPFEEQVAAVMPVIETFQFHAPTP